MISGILWGSLPLCSVACHLGVGGLFSGSTMQVCLGVSVGERQKICKEVGGCVACYLYLG